MNDRELLKKHFNLLMQAKEAGYISDEERAMMCEFARRGAERKEIATHESASDLNIICKMAAENTKLREALEPFIKHADVFGKDWMDDDELDVTPGNDDDRSPPYIEGNTLLFTLKVSDFRQGAKALDHPHQEGNS